jgi:hypothetical protein
VLWLLLTHQNCKVPVAANSQDQLRDTIWPEIAKWHTVPDALKAMIDVQAERIVVVQDPEGAFAVRRTASKENPEALQGFHAEHLLFLIGNHRSSNSEGSGPLYEGRAPEGACGKRHGEMGTWTERVSVPPC